MLPITEELSDYHSELANEMSLSSEPNLFLNMLHVNFFHYFFILISSIFLGTLFKSLFPDLVITTEGQALFK